MRDRRTKVHREEKENKKRQTEKGDILPLPPKRLQIYQMNSERKNYGQSQG